jgi:RHS repeat-associated protein
MLKSYETMCKGLVTRESLAVLTSSQGGVACSAHPASVTVGSFINPQLGAAVFLGKEDLDFALPGALPVVWQRQYSSRVNPEYGSVCGLLGYGWHLPAEISLELRGNSFLLFDAAGRVITFSLYQALGPGGQRYSRSEDLWLLRGGKETQGSHFPGWSRHERFKHVSAELAGDEHNILISNGAADTLWVFTPAPVTDDDSDKASKKTPSKEYEAPPGAVVQHDHDHDHPPVVQAPAVIQRWRLTMQVDRFGRSQRYQYSQGSEADRRYSWQNADDVLPVGRLVALTDGMGRRYRLYHQRIHRGKLAHDLWGADDGWRLAGVELERDPYHSTPDPILLARYGYDLQGQLITVHDRTEELAREFQWHNHRISGHCYRSGPWQRYRYEGAEPDVKVAESITEQGLDYRLEYQDLPPSDAGKPVNVAIVTDSLGRTETYCFEGLAGLNRLAEHHRADGSVMRYQHNSHGRLVASIDPLERKTSIRYDLQGNIIGVQQPGGRQSIRSYDQAGRLTASHDPTGAAISYQYDDWGRCTQITQPDGSVEQYHYPDPSELPLTCDRPARIEDTQGAVNRLQYNDAGQLISYIDSSGHATRWGYDRWGNVVEESNALGKTTRYERDPAGHAIAARQPNRQIRHYQYDRQGNLTSIDPDENAPDSALKIGRDPWGRVVRTSLGGLILQMNWDEAGRLVSLTNENGAQSRFVWDVMDRLVQETGFDGRVQRYQWDAAGQLIQAGDGTVAQAQTQTGGAQASDYRWNEVGRLIERQWPATQVSDMQSQRYEWDEAGRLKAACVYLIAHKQEQEQAEERLQSRIEIERDASGRITGEVQRLYKAQDVPAPTPPIEYEHHIAHQFDPSGSQQDSELQNAGQIQWLFDGSGQVQSLAHEGQRLIEFERNAMHQEIKRQWHTLQRSESAENPPPLLTQTNRWDSLGRLQDTALTALPPQTDPPVPPVLVGQITHRQYRYDTLGQLIALQTPAQTLRYSYTAAGRLRARADSLTPQTTQRWNIDLAGNRLPGQASTPQQQQDWAKLAHWRWQDPAFNLLAQDTAPAQQQDAISKWPDNRIGFYQGCAWRYDALGNRVEQIRQDANGNYSRQRLSYDGGNQLTALHVESIDAQGNVTTLSESRYIYDALGRRLKKTVRYPKKESVIYYGWDGDRLVHTEQMKEDDTRDIVHTIYEPHSFRPLVRLSTTAQGAPQAKPHLVVQAIKAAVPTAHRSEPGIDQSLTMVQSIIAEIPELMQKKLAENLQQVLQSGRDTKGQAIPGVINKINRTNELIANMSKKMEESIHKIAGQHGQSVLGQMPGMARQTSDLVANMRDGLEKMKNEEQGPVTIHYYLCDRSDTPIALADQYGNITWAAKFDPWGNIEEEFNPQDIDQPIRLPGQYHDREAGLYYDINKYYDPKIGCHITQNSVGIGGHMNRYHCRRNPAMNANLVDILDLHFLLGCVAADITKTISIKNFNVEFIKNLYPISNNDTAYHLPVSNLNAQ